MSFLELFHQPESVGSDKPHTDAITQFSDLCRQYAQASISLKESIAPYESQEQLEEDLHDAEEKAAKLQLLGSKPYQEKHRTKLQREEDETANHLKQIESAQQRIIDALISLQRTSSDKPEGTVSGISDLRRQLSSLDAQLNLEIARAKGDPATMAQLRARQKQSQDILQQAEDLEQQHIARRKQAELIRKRKVQLVLLTYQAQREHEKMLRKIRYLRRQLSSAEKKHSLKLELYEAMCHNAQELSFLNADLVAESFNDPAQWDSAKEGIFSQLDMAHQFGVEIAAQPAAKVPAVSAVEAQDNVQDNGQDDPQESPFTHLLDSLQDFLRYKEHTDKLSFDTLLTKLKSIQDASQSYLETAVGTADSEEALALLASPAQQARITYAGALLGFTGTLIPKLENVVSLCAQAKTSVDADAHAKYAVNYMDILDDVVAEQVGVNPMEAPAAPAKPNAPQIKK